MKRTMAYMVYDYSRNEKISDIAKRYNTTVSEIMKINNIFPPYPVYTNDLPTITDSNGKTTKIELKLPLVTNGGQSFEEYNNESFKSTGTMFNSADSLKKDMYINYTRNYESSYAGRYSVTVYGKDITPGRMHPDCYISMTTGGVYNVNYNTYGANNISESMATWYFPCYPDSISDSNQASFNPVPILGRAEPFQYYTSSGPRTVSVKFTMHQEMVRSGIGINYVHKLTAFIESACYPRYNNSGIAANKVVFHCGKDIHIEGIISNVNTDHSGPILDMNDASNSLPMSLNQRYAMTEISFSVTEVLGKSPSNGYVASKGGYRDVTPY